MFKVVFALHLVFAIFLIGPLVHAATTAGRGLRRADGPALASSSRVLRIYAYASVLVVIAGFALAGTTSDFTHQRTASFGETWVWLSVLLWAVAIALVLALVVPTLDRAVSLVGERQPLNALVGRVSAGGGIVAVIFVVITVLMVYRPGS